jgi:hypothetical protein
MIPITTRSSISENARPLHIFGEYRKENLLFFHDRARVARL